jgi:hypothetical protein
MEIVKTSCLTGYGVNEWMKWLEQRRHALRAAQATPA